MLFNVYFWQVLKELLFIQSLLDPDGRCFLDNQFPISPAVVPVSTFDKRVSGRGRQISGL